MGKRRRERDKPKAAPDAVFNPNKRVLLSYTSDDEAENGPEQSAVPDHPSAVHRTVTQYGAVDDGPVVEDRERDAPMMAEAADEFGGDERQDEQQTKPARTAPGPRKDVMTGQLPALGAMSFQWDEGIEGEDYDSIEEEAMAYLRAVRDERQTMPNVLRAPYEDDEEELYDSGVGDSRGFVEDGAYVGRPSIGPVMPASVKTSIDPQEAYMAALKQRFLAMREQMHVQPDESARESWDDKHRRILTVGDNMGYANWHRILRTTAPVPDQVRTMDLDHAVQLLEIVCSTSLAPGQYLSEATCVWIWSLLARLDDVGTMTNDEVHAIRELGKRAVLVQLSFHDPAAAVALQEASADADEALPEADATVGLDLSEDKTGNGGFTKVPELNSPAGQRTLVTLDIIITIVGEVFGQRDLLEFRQDWDIAEQQTEPAPG
ncbi:hypothetical protein LTR53_015488 [Teratosphaeriaceae sp. CCFEE 6253]|nr:hypothetical protein LTR53_015488 [Teratosphaeriaceae sp. CCFEE 6253]